MIFTSRFYYYVVYVNKFTRVFFNHYGINDEIYCFKTSLLDICKDHENMKTLIFIVIIYLNLDFE